jgi:hypothetical protein
MEFFDISLTKASSLLLHPIHISQSLLLTDYKEKKKAILYSGFKNTYKKIRERKKLQSIHK